MSSTTSVAAPPKPKLRGMLDLFGVIVALPATLVLVFEAQPGAGQLGAAIYGPSLVFLLAASTLYHVPNWSPDARRWMRRIDHAAIFILIAGTYTPMCLNAMAPETGRVLLGVVWAIAGVGIVVALLWPAAPRAVNVVLAIAMGWLVVAFGDTLFEFLSAGDITLLLVGGLLYSGGAVAYATRWPNPAPTIYGYHEVFHTGVVIAAVCHYIVVWHVVV